MRLQQTSAEAPAFQIARHGAPKAVLEARDINAVIGKPKQRP
jgi:hypothetical protein